MLVKTVRLLNAVRIKRRTVLVYINKKIGLRRDQIFLDCLQRSDATLCLKQKLAFQLYAMKNLLQLFFFVALAASCQTDSDEPRDRFPFDGTGYRPVYTSADEVAKIEIINAKPLEKPGKIYLLDPYLFINEPGQGIHIINNADPKNPKNLSFISIMGNYDIAAKGEFLYADNLSNLLVFNISDPTAPKLVKTVANVVPIKNYPPFNNVYFECVESKKGIVTGWEKVPMSERPNCSR